MISLEISAQISRTALQRHRSAINEGILTLRAWACCVKAFPIADLCEASFPLATCETLPSWLAVHGWTQELWKELDQRWLGDISLCFDIATYLLVNFKSSERRRLAHDNFQRTQEQTQVRDSAHASVFRARVDLYIENMR